VPRLRRVYSRRAIACFQRIRRILPISLACCIEGFGALSSHARGRLSFLEGQDCGSHRQGMDETHGGLLDGDGFDFLEGGQTLEALLDAVLHQCGHPVFKGGSDHVFCFSFCLNQSLHVVRP
jgi:hypothetical protein